MPCCEVILRVENFSGVKPQRAITTQVVEANEIGAVVARAGGF